MYGARDQLLACPYFNGRSSPRRRRDMGRCQHPCSVGDPRRRCRQPTPTLPATPAPPATRPRPRSRPPLRHQHSTTTLPEASAPPATHPRRLSRPPLRRRASGTTLPATRRFRQPLLRRPPSYAGAAGHSCCIGCHRRRCRPSTSTLPATKTCSAGYPRRVPRRFGTPPQCHLVNITPSAGFLTPRHPLTTWLPRRRCPLRRRLPRQPLSRRSARICPRHLLAAGRRAPPTCHLPPTTGGATRNYVAALPPAAPPTTTPPHYHRRHHHLRHHRPTIGGATTY